MLICLAVLEYDTAATNQVPLRKYQFMEQSTQKRALGLKDKIPDIQRTLDTVQFLKSRDVCSYRYLT